MRRLRAALVAAAVGAVAAGAMADSGAAHRTPDPAPAAEGLPFPVQIDARFALTDQTGRAVTEQDFRGAPMVLFFGYANCQSVCSVALPHIGEAMEILGAAGAPIAPVMITVDPARDTPAALAETLPRYHPRLVGLTGTPEALAEARAVFQVKTEQVAADPDGGPIFAHGSFIYLIDGDGRVKSVLPPILPPERLAEVIRARLLAPAAG